jgi:hypothetical protein
MEQFEEARSNLLLAGEAVHALYRREDSEEAELGAMIVAAGVLAWIAPTKG